MLWVNGSDEDRYIHVYDEIISLLGGEPPKSRNTGNSNTQSNQGVPNSAQNIQGSNNTG